MISEGIIKQKFIFDRLKDATDSAFKFQKSTFQAQLNSKTGNTLFALTSPFYTIGSSKEQFQVIAGVTKQLRFQDLGVRSLYTKPLFGALKHVYGQLQYGLQEEIKEKISEELTNSLNP